MNKKLKFAIPFAVLALSCGIAAAGCGGGNGEHTHDYSAWGHDETQHWKECPDDHEKDNSTVANHVFVAGECECGATEKTGPIVQAKYGTVTGKVKLTKNGVQVTDATVLNGITVDMGDDKVEFTPSVADGVYSFTVTKVEVGKTYELSITCTGYESYSTEILLEEENEVAPIGGANGITLNYETFGLLAGYDGSYHDFSKVNENIIKFLENDGSKTLNVITKETYGDVSASLKLKFNNSTHSFHTQGIVLKFEDGKHLIVRYHNGDQRNGNIQYVNNAWDPCKAEDTLFGTNAGLNQWGEAPIHTLLDAETAAIKADGLDLKVVLKGGTLYSFFDGKFIAKYALPEGYAAKKVQVGYFAWNAASNAEFNYEISRTVPEKMETALDIKVTQPQGVTGCAVTATPEKQAYEFGEQIELSFTAAKGYKLGTLTVGGVDKLKSVLNGKLTITADRPSLEIVATYVQEEPIALDLTVKGKKLGTTAALAQGTTVSFKGTDYTFTVGADGKIANEAVVKGSYTVVVDGYLEKEIEFNEELKEITLEYDTFKEILGWGDFDFTKQNEATPEFGITNDCGVIFTNETYGDVKTSIYLKGNNMNAGNGGLLFRFVGEGLAENGETVTVTMQGTKKVQFSEDKLWDKTTVASGCVWNNLYYFENCHDDDADRTAGANAAKYLEEYAAGTLKLSVARKGATFLVFLDDALIGQMTVNEKYAEAKCEVGFFSANLGNTSDWKSWKVEISKEVSLADVTVTDATAKDANGTIEISEGAKLGDTVTITVKPATGYMLDKLTVSGGVTPTAGNNNTYTFVAAEKTYTVTATFKEAPAVEAEAAVTGIGLGASAVDMNGKEITFKPATGAETKLTVTDGKVKGILAEGEYTVSCEGFYDLTATVAENGSFAEGTSLAFSRKLFVFNYLNEGGINDNGDSTAAATESKIKAKNDGNVFEWSTDNYDDIAFTTTLKDGNGNQGVFVHFVGTEKAGVKIRFENTKAQYWSGWGWGINNVAGKWDFMDNGGANYANPMSDELLAKYRGDGLKLTVLRKGAMVYALIDGEVYSAQIISNTSNVDCATAKVKFGVFVESAKQGYEIPFEVSTDVDSILNAAKDAHNVLGALGKWTVTDTTLAVTGDGYAEVAPTDKQTKESLKINIAAKNSSNGNHTQGLVYRFDNGKWLAARIESNENASYIQYSQDALLPSCGGYLRGWTLVHDLTAEEKTAFNGDGVELQLVRDGKCVYVLLGGNVIDKVVLGDEYGEMDGVIAATIQNGTGTAYAYEYKAGENVTVPQVYTVNASFDGAANGYDIVLDKSVVAKDGIVTLTVKTQNDWWNAWSMFPTKINVNGVDTELTVADLVSDGANKLHYTKELTVTADTEIKVTVAKGTVISKGVVVTVKDSVGGTATSDSGENGYYWNDACTLYMTPAEGYEIASITVDGGEPITAGWTFNSAQNRYEYNIADPIQKAITVVVEFRAVTPAA